MSSQGDWILPGLRSHPLGNLSLVSSISLAYSSLSNRRRLEHPLYTFWGKALNYLVEDLEPGALIAPQYTVYKSSKAHPNISFGTVADDNAEEKIPDFTVMGVVLAERLSKEILRHTEFPRFFDWHLAQLAISKPLCAFEGKRMPCRHLVSMLSFQRDLLHWLDAAMLGAEHQASIIFRESSYNAQSLILIAAAGEWWKFKFVTAAEFKKKKEERIDRGILGGLDEKSTKPSQNNPLQAKSFTEEKTKGLSRFTTIVPKHMERFKENVADAKPRGWSDCILFGTRESNQRLYLIHEELKRMSANLEIEALAQLQQWIDDGYDSADTMDDEDEEQESEDEMSSW